MGLERASTIGGDGIGVSGMANIEQTLTEAAGNPVNSNQLLVKNMPSLSVLFSPLANPNGAVAQIQIAQRGANAVNSLNWLPIQSVVIGGIAPVTVELRFPTDFMRVVITPNGAGLTQILCVLGCSA